MARTHEENHVRWHAVRCGIGLAGRHCRPGAPIQPSHSVKPLFFKPGDGLTGTMIGNPASWHISYGMLVMAGAMIGNPASWHISYGILVMAGTMIGNPASWHAPKLLRTKNMFRGAAAFAQPATVTHLEATPWHALITAITSMARLACRCRGR